MLISGWPRSLLGRGGGAENTNEVNTPFFARTYCLALSFITIMGHLLAAPSLFTNDCNDLGHFKPLRASFTPCGYGRIAKYRCPNMLLTMSIASPTRGDARGSGIWFK